MRIEYYPSTVSDLKRAVSYYESLRYGLGAECRAEIYETIERILEPPRRYRIVDEDVRRALVHRFPFFYRVIGDERVRILVIRHHRQRDDFGRSRR